MQVNLWFLLTFISLNVYAVEYKCPATSQFGSSTLSPYIEKNKPFVRVEENGSSTFISRCDVDPGTKKESCDKYKVDKVAFDQNVKIKKYYIFSSQHDFQIFSDLTSIENNGRGGIYKGKCTLVSP